VGEGWRIEKDYLGDTLVTDVFMQNDELGLRIRSNDLVDFEEDLYLKKITVENLWDESREIQLFLTQDFHISGNEIGDTAAFKPEVQGMLHHKGERHFLTGLFANHKFGIDSYAAGNDGTWIDCEDGVLSQNPIAQGSVEEGKPSNPWFVTTLWKAQYLTALAKSAEELKPVLEILEWVADKALQSGVMAEQLRAETLEPVSVSPLTWSHGTFIAAVQKYLSRLSEMEKCPSCGLPKQLKRGSL